MSNAAPSVVPPPVIRLTPAELAALRCLVRLHGVQGASKRTGLSRHAITSLLAETDVQTGTVLQARHCLAPFVAERCSPESRKGTQVTSLKRRRPATSTGRQSGSWRGEEQ